MDKIDAIILAGGLGTRIRGIAGDLPKVLLPVSGRPFLDILLENLDKSGIIGKVILAVGYQADRIVERYREARAFSFGIGFSVETTLLGTGGGIKKALSLTDSDTVLAMNGDSYVEIDLRAMLSAHRAKQAALTLAVQEVPDASRYGRVLMGSDGRLLSFEEKSPDRANGYINAGLYLFNKELLDGIAEGQVLSWERELLPGFLQAPAYGFLSRGKFIDIGIPETYGISGDYLKGQP